MAQDLDDGEFWLPSQFLTDDDILMEKQKINRDRSTESIGVGFCFPSEFPYGFDSFGSSALSSPVESVVSSTETESDEEDYLAGLTQQMVHSTLQEVERNTNSAFGSEKPKAWVLSASPQSTLCEVGSWSAGSRGSSRGSPNGPSQVSSPPTTPMNGKDDAWELLYAAAGQVVRMKMNDEGARLHNHGRGLLGPPRKPTPISAPPKNPNVGVFSNQGLTPQQQLQATQFHQLKQQQNADVWGRNGKHAQTAQHHHQHLRNGVASGGGFSNGRCVRPLGLSSSAWPPLQHQQQHQPQPQPQQPGSGMRAVFLGGSGTRRESSGTGVFLPRRIGNTSDSRKKPACSTVLLPARVVQALNLNFEDMGGAQQRFNGGYSLDHGKYLPPFDYAMISRNNVLLSQQKQRNLRPQPVLNPEIRLPQEWTY
ncbi:hypothetical protein BVC80_1835g123 [Macleaya cordata]|uniref:TIP41-like protein n=1 Tax=Macleaya cordata TaxID=56857 RepID=A0A200R4W4_MACCD|nr:hypothetical protein BVC80_1835g123 [Macleaya cordata]